MVLIIGLAFLGGLLMSWAIGATNAPAFGPVNSAQAAPVYRGAMLVGIASFLGAVTQGGNVANTMGNRLVEGAAFTPVVSAVILLTAATLILASTLSNIPMPSAFLLVGATIGAGYAIGGTPDIGTVRLIGAFWLVIPVVGSVIGYVTALVMRHRVEDTRRNRRYIRLTLLVLGTYTAYTAGANQAGLPVGPLMGLVDVPILYLLVFAGAGMVLGAWTASPRIIQAVSRDYSRMGPRRAVGALLAASLIAQTATLFGVPISFSQTVIFSVIGSGLVEGTGGVGTRKIVRTVGAWLIALSISTTVTYGLTRVVTGM